ncbi:MAG: MaoC/PaaZ C-terminal domain-containing protein [Bacteroidales bacterium]
MSINKAVQYGRYFEEFTLGDVYAHDLRKTITESDNNLFSLLTMNHHPVHLDQEYVKEHQHGKVLVVGTLVSLVVGITLAM